MKKLVLFIIIIIGISSCKKSGWSQEDQDRFMKDCLSMDENPDEIEDYCKCGLNVMMENYSSLEEARKAIERMSKEEAENLFIDCAF